MHLKNKSLKFHLATYWHEFKKIAFETIKQAFPRYPYKISGHLFDSFSKKTLFLIKIQGVSTHIKLTAKEIITNDHYFPGLSSHDKQQITQQYLIDILNPKAMIIEYPIDDEDPFKIILVEENKIICLKAKSLIEEERNIFHMLSKKDIMRITIHYYEQKYFDYPNKFINNVHLISAKVPCSE